ncbi:MAG: hypothetical protein HY596_03915 [Candidatus Omnitrophica bacterium]|nr:hypothetical protein [Candidatus Omnitrophota bacterium]
MTPKDRLTPEEKLLQVIDNPAAAKPRGTLGRLGRRASAWSLGMGWVLDRLRGGRPGSGPVVTLRMVNRGLAIIGGVLALAWLADFFALRSEFLTRLEMVERTQLIAPTQTKGASLPTLDFAGVLERARARNIFTFLPPKTETPAPAAPVVEDLSPYVAELKLVGIIWSDNPQAMIEQTKEEKTYLLGTGEKIGPLRIKKILREKVLLGPQTGEEEEWELR